MPIPEISRVPRTKDKAKAAYDKTSRWYDVLADSSEQKFVRLGLEKLSAAEGEVVLEIGYGTGHTLVALAQTLGESDKVYGIDISEGMRNLAQEEVERVGLAEQVEMRIGDAAHLPFEGGFFDAIFVSFTLQLFNTPEIPVVLAQCRRVLRSGGRLAVVAMSKKGDRGSMLRLYEWAHERISKYVDCRPIYARQSLEEAGFQVVEAVVQSMWGLPVEIVVAKNSLKSGRPKNREA